MGLRQLQQLQMVDYVGADVRWSTREVPTPQEKRQAGTDHERNATCGSGARQLPRPQMVDEPGGDVRGSTREGRRSGVSSLPQAEEAFPASPQEDILPSRIVPEPKDEASSAPRVSFAAVAEPSEQLTDKDSSPTQGEVPPARKRSQRSKKAAVHNENFLCHYRPGTIQTMVPEIKQYKLDLVVVQETGWLGEGTHKEDGYTLFYGGCVDKHEFGTGFVIHNKAANSVKEFKAVNKRISYIVLGNQESDITFINVHAPTEDKTDDKKEEFYHQLEQTIESTPTRNIRIVLGDFNGKAGKKEEEEEISV
ncbi:craniofacial development protein 2-like [Schistocerca americana]|uniref:craniofacial development protein 2-like n=1 Tax=Schistocerca americana TaxID=7009 RepID=UPI001F5017B3|nr:craniofacial development protein 2-like [Schistocerca americana]